MSFVNPHRMINQNSLGRSQSGGLKNRKSIFIMTDDFDKFSLLLFFDVSALL